MLLFGLSYLLETRSVKKKQTKPLLGGRGKHFARVGADGPTSTHLPNAACCKHTRDSHRPNV